MKGINYLVACIIALISLSCNRYEQSIVGPVETNQLGKVTLSIVDAPANITTVIAKLSRRHAEERILILSISDSGNSAMGIFTDVPIGKWHLKVDAFDINGIVRYSGETEVNVLSGETIIVELNLFSPYGNIDIRVSWGKKKILIPDPTKWECTQDARGDGSQSKLVNNNGVIEIHPVNHVHFVNRSINKGRAKYKFMFKGNNFHFGWRISTSNSQLGTALLLAKVPNGDLVLMHVNWERFYYGWHNNYKSFGNSLNFNFNYTTWHQVEIHDSGTDLEIFFDGQKLNIFENQIPASQFLATVGNGYIGIGNDDYSIVSYKDFQIIPY